jgi:uncharacterized membrane protein YedE/YeeE
VNLAVAFASGLVFAIGLGFSGMLKPEKVIGFLELTDPTLLYVMGPAVAVYFLATWKHRARGPQRPLDLPLVAGAALFGVGWGLTGICPGPAIVNLARPDAFFLTFVAALVAGIGVRSLLKSAAK